MNIGVVIPTVARPDDLARCLSGLERQTALPQETLVVTAFPDARTDAVVAGHGGRLGARVVPGTTRGVQAQRNIGVEHLSPEVDVVLFLDDDVIVADDYVERLAAVLEREPDVGGVSGVTDSLPPERPPWLRAWRRVFLGPSASRPVVTRAGINLPLEFGESPVDAEWLGGCAAYRRAVVDQFRFDEALKGYALLDDVDFSLRAGRAHRLVVVPAASLEHRRSPASRVSEEEFGYQFVRNRRWLVNRHRRGLRSLVAFWWTTCGYALVWVASSVRGNALAKARLHGMLRGVSAVLRGDLPSTEPSLSAVRPGTVAVVVPTVVGREAALERCLAGVRAQTRPPDEICVVRGCASPAAAVREGFSRTSAEWVAFLDDDAIPQSDWLEALSRHAEDPTIGAVGGRILNFPGGRTSARRYEAGPVARLTWYGRSRSRLHDIPLSRIVEEADFLPGSNMCFRRAALPDAESQLEAGMAPGFETALCLAVRRAGWRVVFDSDALVTHYPAPRPQHLQRGERERESYEYSYVVTYTLLRYLPWPRKLAFLVYFLLVGQRVSPGLVFAPYFLLPGRSRTRFRAAWAGKIRGLREVTA